VDADDEDVAARQQARHVDDAAVPAAVAGDEEGDARRVRARAIEVDVAEAADGEGALLGARGAGESDGGKQRQGNEAAERVHRATTPLKPPAMSAERWARMRGSATPPGEAR